MEGTLRIVIGLPKTIVVRLPWVYPDEPLPEDLLSWSMDTWNERLATRGAIRVEGPLRLYEINNMSEYAVFLSGPALDPTDLTYLPAKPEYRNPYTI